MLAFEKHVLPKVHYNPLLKTIIGVALASLCLATPPQGGKRKHHCEDNKKMLSSHIRWVTSWVI